MSTISMNLTDPTSETDIDTTDDINDNSTTDNDTTTETNDMTTNTTTLSQTDINTINDLSENLPSNPDPVEICDNIASHIEDNDNPDFEVDNVRFIHSDHVESAIRERLLSDNEQLGMMATGFLSDVSGILQEAIEALQLNGNYEELGNTVAHAIERGHSHWHKDLSRLVCLWYEHYSAVLGVAQHDYSDVEFTVNSGVWYAFDNQ